MKKNLLFIVLPLITMISSCSYHAEHSAPNSGSNSALNSEINPTLSSVVQQGLCEPVSQHENPLQGIKNIIDILPPVTGLYPYFQFLEGPVWVDNVDAGSLYFSDLVAPARIWKLTPPSTVPVLYFENSGSNGLALTANNQLIIADREKKRITQLNLNTKNLVEIVPSNGKFKPNDVIVRHDNTMYFTASKSGFFQVAADGTLSKPITVVYSPNGIALSLDQNQLYIGDFTNKTITIFQLSDDGSVNEESAKLFATTQGDKVDGMTVDCAGNLYVGTTLGVEVFTSTGEQLGIIPTGRSSNVMFGGVDRKTLYVTTPKILKAVQLSVSGPKHQL